MKVLCQDTLYIFYMIFTNSDVSLNKKRSYLMKKCYKMPELRGSEHPKFFYMLYAEVLRGD